MRSRRSAVAIMTVSVLAASWTFIAIASNTIRADYLPAGVPKRPCHAALGKPMFWKCLRAIAPRESSQFASRPSTCRIESFLSCRFYPIKAIEMEVRFDRDNRVTSLATNDVLVWVRLSPSPKRPRANDRHPSAAHVLGKWVTERALNM